MICTQDDKTLPAIESAEIYAGYNDYVGESHQVTCSARGWDYSEMIAQAGLQQGHVVLDIGCASSYFALFIADMVKRSYGIDDVNTYAFETYTIPWLRTLKDFTAYKEGLFTFILGNAARLPFPDNFFDRIFTCSAMEHFLDDDDILCSKEIARVLKPGGAFIGTVDYNPVTEYPLAPDMYTRVYTYKSLFDRIIAPSDLRLHGKDYVSDMAIPESVEYIADVIFFHLVKD